MTSPPLQPPLPLSESPVVAPGYEMEGRYRVERILGQGGMGLVVAAQHLQLGERVAIKLMKLPADRAKPQDIERFRREARAAARIKGQHAVRAMDSGAHQGMPYIVFEYATGENLSSRLKTQGPLPVEIAVDYALQVCEALAEAHALGIIHRDLKPANIMLSSGPDGSPLVKVLDFGIARLLDEEAGTLTGSSSTLGSPKYMPPEQIRNAHQVDARADIWSLGVTLFEMLTGRVPFEAVTAPALFAAILVDAPMPLRRLAPEYAPELESVLLRCLEKDPANRFQDIAQLAEHLAPFVPEGKKQAARIRRILGRHPSVEPSIQEQASTSDETAPPEPLFNTLGQPTSVTAEREPGTGPSAPPRKRPQVWLVGLALLVGLGAFRLATPSPSKMASPAESSVVSPPPALSPPAQPPVAQQSAEPPGTAPQAPSAVSVLPSASSLSRPPPLVGSPPPRRLPPAPTQAQPPTPAPTPAPTPPPTPTSAPTLDFGPRK